MKIRPVLFTVAAVLLLAAGCFNHSPAASRSTSTSASGGGQTGLASWYGEECNGSSTASGETFDMYAYTAAHPKLPFGTRVRVTNLANGRSVTVRINDRGPWTGGRIIDLSYAAAKEIGMIEAGVVQVRLEVLD